MLGNEQRPRAERNSPSLEEIVAERVAAEAARIAEERIREMFAVTEFDPDEVYGFMGSEEAAAFLGLPYSSFREIAPSLPRHHASAVRVPKARTPSPLRGPVMGRLSMSPVVSLQCGCRLRPGR
jgi:hypothetical protein